MLRILIGKIFCCQSQNNCWADTSFLSRINLARALKFLKSDLCRIFSADILQVRYLGRALITTNPTAPRLLTLEALSLTCMSY